VEVGLVRIRWHSRNPAMSQVYVNGKSCLQVRELRIPSDGDQRSEVMAIAIPK